MHNVVYYLVTMLSKKVVICWANPDKNPEPSLFFASHWNTEISCMHVHMLISHVDHVCHYAHPSVDKLLGSLEHFVTVLFKLDWVIVICDVND